MTGDAATVELSLADLWAVAGYAASCARTALSIFEQERPDDPRPRTAIDAAQAFADGGDRTKALRDAAWAAQRAATEARDARQAAASGAPRAALGAAGAAFPQGADPSAGRVATLTSSPAIPVAAVSLGF